MCFLSDKKTEKTAIIAIRFTEYNFLRKVSSLDINLKTLKKNGVGVG